MIGLAFPSKTLWVRVDFLLERHAAIQTRCCSHRDFRERRVVLACSAGLSRLHSTVV